MVLIFCSDCQCVKTQKKLWQGAVLSRVLRPVESIQMSADYLMQIMNHHCSPLRCMLQDKVVVAISWWQYSTRLKTSQHLKKKKINKLFHLPVRLVVILTWGNSRWDCGKEMNLMREMELPGLRSEFTRQPAQGCSCAWRETTTPITGWSVFTIDFTKFNSKGLTSLSSALVNQNFTFFFSIVVHLNFLNWASLRQMWRK